MPKTPQVRALFLIALTLSASATAQVYKHVDEATGKVTYSDVPQSKGDQPISLPEPTTIQMAPAPKSSTSSDATKPATAKTFSYDSVEVVSPANEEAIRSNSGDVTVQLRSNPGLQGNHIYVVIVDGAKVQEGSGSSVSLSNLDRGSHTVVAHIQDESERTLASSSPVTFHLFRASTR